MEYDLNDLELFYYHLSSTLYRHSQVHLLDLQKGHNRILVIGEVEMGEEEGEGEEVEKVEHIQE
jgi:hypothetical protein